MSTLDTKILTPYGQIYQGQATGVNMPGTEGAFEVKHNHAGLMSMLEIGKVLVRESGGSEQVFSLNGGFVEVLNNQVTILAESAEKKGDIDVERAKIAKERAEQEIKKQKVADKQVELALKRAINRLNIADL